MDTLKEQLFVECDYRMAGETMDKFLGLMTGLELKVGESLIPYGKLDSNIYIVKSGIIRYCYFDGLKEKTFGFALPGTMIIPYYSYYMRLPSFFQLESCSKSVVMKVAQASFDELIQQSSDFAQWVLRMSLGQLWFYEMKLAVVNGTAKERFEALFKTRPEIIQQVSSKVIASYIGITPPSLSRLKRQLMLDSQKNRE